MMMLVLKMHETAIQDMEGKEMKGLNNKTFKKIQ